MDKLMKLVKSVVFVGACGALTFSLTPLFAQPQEEHKDDGSGGSGGSMYSVSCTYDGDNNLVSKTCNSGGQYACSC